MSAVGKNAPFGVNLSFMRDRPGAINSDHDAVLLQSQCNLEAVSRWAHQVVVVVLLLFDGINIR